MTPDKTYEKLTTVSAIVRDRIDSIIIDVCRRAQIAIPALFFENHKSAAKSRTTGLSVARAIIAKRLREEISDTWTLRELGDKPISLPSIAGILRLRDHVSVLRMIGEKVTA